MKYTVVLVAQVINSKLYEADKKLVRAIKSFLNQTHKDKELIIISNGCIKTKLIYEKYFQQYKEIFLFYNITELPLYASVINNKAIEMSSINTDYILYLNQNDVLGSKHLESIDNEIKKNPNFDIYYYDIYNPLSDTFKNLKKTYIELRINSITSSSFIHKKTNILWNDGIGNDWKLIMKMIYNGLTHSKIENTQYIKGDIIYDDKIKQIPTDNSTKRVAVLMHLFYIDLWDDFKTKIDNIDAKCDIYVNLVEGSYDEPILTEFKNNILQFKNVKVFISKNKGLDIGGTLVLLNYIFENNLEYDYILKIHSKKSIHSGRGESKYAKSYEKTGEEWRNLLINPLIGDKEVINNILTIFDSNKEVGMIGGKRSILKVNDKFALRNIGFINEYSKTFNMNVPLIDIKFVAGTMFWVRFDLFKDYFSKIKPLTILEELEENAFTDAGVERRTHALERVFGLMVLNKNMKIIGV